MGVSKEQRKQPIVQMGLFMDEQGVPISIETFPGNTLDHLTLKNALNKTIIPTDIQKANEATPSLLIVNFITSEDPEQAIATACVIGVKVIAIR